VILLVLHGQQNQVEDKDMEFSLKATILNTMYDADGNYIGNPARVLMHNGEVINIDDYAAANGFTLPDSGE